ncbi:G protein-coupled receptor kinase 2 [Eumeta japonica]|uniref:G protein-coupled receptor kinase 2 n=1 Tax=Eumeta variegata TaxID=151549 RepID=A0A4C1ZDP7_EUMVA|nr:G protein-coupled receptor kinase 2 [Eumeta japonica]
MSNKLDVVYDYVVDQQPIGKLLFRQFCERNRPDYHKYNSFLDAAERYEVEVDETRAALAVEVFERYLKSEEGDGGGGEKDDGGDGRGERGDAAASAESVVDVLPRNAVDDAATSLHSEFRSWSLFKTLRIYLPIFFDKIIHLNGGFVVYDS